MSVLGKTNALVNLYNAIMHTMNGSNELFYWNKREAYALLQGAGHQLPGGLPQDGFVSSIKDTGSNVKTKYAGQTNTPQFKRWFGKSKAVNPDGTPKLFYHGTPNGTFNVFRNWQYFTENEWYADVYQNQGASSNGYKRTTDNPKTYAVYLKAEKPFDTRNARERSIFMREFYQKWGNGTPLSDRGLPDWTDADDLIKFFEEKGYDYDSIIVDEGGTGGYGDEVKDRGISWHPRLQSDQVRDGQHRHLRFAGPGYPLPGTRLHAGRPGVAACGRGKRAGRRDAAGIQQEDQDAGAPSEAPADFRHAGEYGTDLRTDHCLCFFPMGFASAASCSAALSRWV